MRLVLTDDEGTVVDMWTEKADPDVLQALMDVLPHQSPTKMVLSDALAKVE